MACTFPSAPPAPVAEAPSRAGRAMTRCECAEMSFAEVRQRLRRDNLTLEEVARRTGCASTCTACLPDLRAFLSRA
ncbi:MAG TPA: (2Fe-2S)-binding protein [Vicinamibacteria bacterium]